MADETTRTPDETLRAAAQRLRQFISGTTHGPWIVTKEEDDWWWHITERSGIEVADASELADAVYVAAMHPDVAAALAAWLDKEADGWDLMPAAERAAIASGDQMHMQYSTWDEALTVARAVLGEA